MIIETFDNWENITIIVTPVRVHINLVCVWRLMSLAIRIKLKMLSLSLCAALTGSMILSSGVAAAQTGSVSQQDKVSVIIDGELQEFSQPAVTVDGRTLVPLRGIFEALGAKVEWDNATRTATGTKDGVKVVVQIDNQSKRQTCPTFNN
jgi:hypothetical protein